MLEQCCNGYQSCGGDFTTLMAQITIICTLIALIGAMVIVRYPAWFDVTPAAAAQSIAGR